MRFIAYDKDNNELLSKDFYSVGGGFIISHNKLAQQEIIEDATQLPYNFSSGTELLALCKDNKLTIAEIMYANERTWLSKAKINKQLDHLWDVFKDCVARGLKSSGVLPGGLKVKRRAPELFNSLRDKPQAALRDPFNHIRLGKCLCTSSERRKCSRLTCCNSSNERCRRNHTCCPPLLLSF